MLDLELADEAEPVAEAVVEQQHEAVEVEQGIFVLGPVEMKVHVAGDGPGLRGRRRLIAPRCLRRGHDRLSIAGAGRSDRLLRFSTTFQFDNARP